ncbi:MAG: hypothetical protein HKN36_10980 [Hellea sp.]|nr:hypothetical protein [Hellea sp.]
MKKSRYLIATGLVLCLFGGAYAGPPDGETEGPKEEKTESLEFQIPEKIVQDGKKAGDVTVVAPRDKASGMATGKRQHTPATATKEIDKASPMMWHPNAQENTTTMNKGEVISEIATEGARDAASGLATGKRQHKPLNVTSEIDSASPMSSESKPEETTEKSMTFEEAVAVCRLEDDLQTCVDRKTGQTIARELDKSSTK